MPIAYTCKSILPTTVGAVKRYLELPPINLNTVQSVSVSFAARTGHETDLNITREQTNLVNRDAEVLRSGARTGPIIATGRFLGLGVVFPSAVVGSPSREIATVGVATLICRLASNSLPGLGRCIRLRSTFASRLTGGSATS